MATTVGTEDTITDLVTNLILLERDAIAVYESTISRLSDPALSQQVETFRQGRDGEAREVHRHATQAIAQRLA